MIVSSFSIFFKVFIVFLATVFIFLCDLFSKEPTPREKDNDSKKNKLG